MSSLFVQLSLLTIIILSLQSSITLAYPYHYQSIITKRRLITVFVVCWLFVLLMSLGMFRFPEVAFYGSYCIIGSTIFIVVVTWFRTCKLVARHRKAIQNTQTPSSSKKCGQKESPAVNSNRIRHYFKSTGMLLLRFVLLVFKKLYKCFVAW